MPFDDSGLSPPPSSPVTGNPDLCLALKILRRLERAMSRGIIDGRRAERSFQRLLARLPGVSFVSYQPWGEISDPQCDTGRPPVRFFPVTCGDKHYGTLIVDLKAPCPPRTSDTLLALGAASLGAILHAQTLREENGVLRRMLGSDSVRRALSAAATDDEDTIASIGRVELARIVASAVEIASAVFEVREQRFTSTVPDLGLPIEADVDQMAGVVASLLANVAVHAPRGGNIQVQGMREGGWAALCVLDDDLGIHLEHSDEGLDGLRMIVEQHGGTVSFSSPRLGPSTFTVRLPLARATGAAREGADDIGKPGGKVIRLERLLVVARDRPAAAHILEILESDAQLVRAVFDTTAALEAAARLQPTLIIVDPRLAGREELVWCVQQVARHARVDLAPLEGNRRTSVRAPAPGP